MHRLMSVLEAVNGVLWHDAVLFTVLGVGVLFTLWSGFGQYRALTHGVQVIRGLYDRKDDPGAINHFQALSTALSATVGLGNIAGVAIAISLGGPGAVFWMWVTGLVGMALKMTEVIQAMLYRTFDAAGQPHGGAMWVIRRGLAQRSPRLASLGSFLGGVFCVTLLVSAITGGNMFQAWNVADVTNAYFGVPGMVTGAVMTVLVGMVILGGITRIGSVTGKLVPLMCGLYILAGLVVIALRIEQVPDAIRLVFASAFRPAEAQGAFLGGVAGWAFLRGMQRALFSNEAGQGSAPIAHSAARTDEPVREGVVAGLEPFVDTLCVCTITALVILLSGAWNRGPDILFPAGTGPRLVEVAPAQWAPELTTVEGLAGWPAGQDVYLVVRGDVHPQRGTDSHRLYGEVVRVDGSSSIAWQPLPSNAAPRLAQPGLYAEYKGATLTARAFDRVVPGLGIWLVPAVAWLFAISTIISWSYYGEQGSVYLFGVRSVRPYRALYCLLVLVASSPLIRTEAQLDVVSSLGTGVMLFANIPIMLLFGPQAMRAYHGYMARLRRGEMDRRSLGPE